MGLNATANALTVGSNGTLSLQPTNYNGSTSNFSAVSMVAGTYSNTSGNVTPVLIAPVYNQASSGSGSDTDFKINRTETALSSGARTPSPIFRLWHPANSSFAPMASSTPPPPRPRPLRPLSVLGTAVYGSNTAILTTPDAWEWVYNAGPNTEGRSTYDLANSHRVRCRRPFRRSALFGMEGTSTMTELATPEISKLVSLPTLAPAGVLAGRNAASKLHRNMVLADPH